MAIRFGEFAFDPETRELRRAGRCVALSPKAFDLLGVLITQRPRVVPRRELHDLLWPATYVAHTSLPRLVSEIRRALGDRRGQSRYVRTVYGRGYAFAGVVDKGGPSSPPAGRTPATGPCPRLLWAGREMPLPDGVTSIGRGRDSDVRIPHERVSRHHAQIVVAAGEATIEDLQSRNGTFVQGRRIAGLTKLADGDTITIGALVLTFLDGGDEGSTKGSED